jgi:hypothetical protein
MGKGMSEFCFKEMCVYHLFLDFIFFKLHTFFMELNSYE